MIQIKNLKKAYKNLQVLKGIDLEMEKGKIYAFLGPNGSGKTTLLKCLLGLVNQDDGEVLIKGRSITKDSGYRSFIGYMPQIARFPENLKVMELINMVCDIRGVTSNAAELLEYFQLKEHINKPLRDLSGGMKQKVNAIITLLFDPEILVFDEPSVGLDPVSHIKLKQRILFEKEKGKTIILTTHILGEVEELADEIIFLLEGKIFFHGTLDTLLREQGENKLERAIAKISNKSEYEAFLKPSRMAS
jgi:Cu-processing system ATP-binding protein